MSFLSHLHFWSWTALVLLLGYTLGVLAFQVERAAAPSPVTPLNRDVHAARTEQRRIPVVRLGGILNGRMHGSVGTGARLIIGEHAVLPAADRTFSADASPFLVNIVTVEIPEGARFVASTRGTNYYPVDSSEGEKLVPENRVYFQSEEEAEAAGYRAKGIDH